MPPLAKTQSATGSLLDALGVELRWRYAPDDDRGDVQQQIEQALDETLQELGFVLSDKIAQGRKNRVLLTAAQRLSRQSEFGAAAVLAFSAGRSVPLLKVLIRALEESRRPDLVTKFLTEVGTRDHFSQGVMEYLFQMRMKYRVGLSPDDHIRFWGPIDKSLPDVLANLKEGPGMYRHAQQLAQVLTQMRGNPGERAVDVLAGLKSGFAAEHYARFAVVLSRMIENDQFDTSDPAAQQMADLCLAMKDIYIEPDYTELDQQIANGRGIVILRAHTGMTAYFAQNFRHVTLPHVSIAANESLHNDAHVGRNGGFHLSVRGNFQTEFLRLVKAMRKSPHFVVIFPDGARGGEFVERNLLGRTIQIGQGAATLAYRGKSAVFFMGTEWRDGKCHGTLTAGPVATDFDDRDAFDTAFFDFYTAQLEQIVLGDPRDMMGAAGFWPMLLADNSTDKE